MADPVWLDNYRTGNGIPVVPEDPEQVQALINSAQLQVTPELQMYLAYRVMLAVMTP
jgi:hypothetical protein